MIARRTLVTGFAFAASLAASLSDAAQLTPGMYEYTIKMNVPGAPGALVILSGLLQPQAQSVIAAYQAKMAKRANAAR